MNPSSDCQEDDTLCQQVEAVRHALRLDVMTGIVLVAAESERRRSGAVDYSAGGTFLAEKAGSPGKWSILRPSIYDKDFFPQEFLDQEKI